MTVKERLQQVISEMNEEEAADALAQVAGARAGATPFDIYGTAWERSNQVMLSKASPASWSFCADLDTRKRNVYSRRELT